MSMKKYVDKRSHTGKVTTIMLCNKQAICHTKSAQYEQIVAKIKESLADAIADFEIKMKEQENNNIDIHKQRITSLKDELNKLYNKDVRQKMLTKMVCILKRNTSNVTQSSSHRYLQ